MDLDTTITEVGLSENMMQTSKAAAAEIFRPYEEISSKICFAAAVSEK
jgi:hypothetical protein